MKDLVLQSVVYKEGKHFVAQCLDVDVSSFGSSESEALAALQEALELYFEDHQDQDIEPIKDPRVHKLRMQHA